MSAWNSASGLTQSQVRTVYKAREITAKPELLASLYIKGGIIAIEAIGCQHDIPAKIVASGPDSMLGVRTTSPFEPRQSSCGSSRRKRPDQLTADLYQQACAHARGKKNPHR